METTRQRRWMELRTKTASFDTQDLIKTTRQSRYGHSHTFSTSRQCFYLTTSVPIRNWKLEKNYASQWKPSRRESDKGTKSCSATLVGDGWDYHLEGTIILYRWKNDVREKDLEKARDDLDEAWTTLSTTRQKIPSTKREITDAEAKLSWL